jgi:hypothetical protein
MRDEFSAGTKELLPKRVGYRCSNPQCRQPTSGPQDDPTKVINVGVAAHITGASPDGPRYDPSLTSEQRCSVENGIWLCQTCGKLADNDESRYSVESLMEWKRIAELAALRELEQRRSPRTEPDAAFLRAEHLMPDLIAEMRKDLTDNPLSREFVALKKSGAYWSKGHELAYFYEEHPDLDNKLRILESLGLVQDITYNNTKRFVVTEKLAEYLSGNDAA